MESVLVYFLRKYRRWWVQRCSWYQVINGAVFSQLRQHSR